MSQFYTYYTSPIGRLTLVASDNALSGVFFEQHCHHQHDPNWQESSDLPVLHATKTQLGEYFAGLRRHFDLPLHVAVATDFQRTVWRALLDIPYAETVSYGALAQKIGRPKAVRALGAANGRNPFSIIVPCHRVIAANGQLHGYAGGLENKRALLDFEVRVTKMV